MYLLLKNLHIAAVITSISLFLLRGILMMARSPRLHSRILQVLPHVVDTVLLASGVGLILVLGIALLTATWLQVKLTLLIAYIVAGSVALKRGRTYRIRLLTLAAALIIVATIIATALTHQPLGFSAS